MGKASGVVRPLLGLSPKARRVGCAASVAALLLGCSGSSETRGNNGGSDQSESGGGAAGKPSSASGGNIASSAGDGAIGGSAQANGGASNTTGGTSSGGGGIIIGRAGAQGRAGSSGSNAAGSLGSPCASDAECGTGMVCATASSTLFGDGGPANGMCTLPCTASGSECSTLKAGAECFDFGTTDNPRGYCLDSCEVGSTPDPTTKCAGRADFVCADLNPTGPSEAYCVPHCRADADCGSGLYCDKSALLGLCSKTKHDGDPVGAACTPSATTTTCQGVCLRTSADGVTPEIGVCAELCAIGTECMYGSGTNPTPGGFCGGTLTDVADVLDLGFCLADCSCTSDCKIPGDLCRKWPTADADLASLLGAPGVCYPTVAESVELSCGQGGVGGAPAQTAGSGGSNP